MRYLLFDHWTPDTSGAIADWYRILKHTGFKVFSRGFYNYTPLYPYLLYLSSVVFGSLKTIIVIKLPAVLFDYLCAFVVYKLVRLRYTRGPIPFFALFATLFLPTVFINSSMWGQSDIIYTTALLATVYFTIKHRDYPAWICFGIAVTLKLQAMFLAPLLVALILKGRLSVFKAWTVPVIYVLSVIPAWLAGRPLSEFFLIYVQQYQAANFLSLNAPTMFVWFPNELYSYFVPAGLVIGLAVIFLFGLIVFKSNTELTPPAIIQLAALSVTMLPFFLPKMHDRYFFPADVFALVFAFYFPRFCWIAIAIELTSLFSYFPYLFQFDLFPLKYLALVILFAIVGLVWNLPKVLSWEGINPSE